MRGPSGHHPLLDLIQQLYSARELVVDAYERSGVDLDDKALKQIEPLLKTHLLRKEGSSGIRLNQRLQKVFDAALRKDRIAAISTDLHSELQAADLAMRQLQDVKNQGMFDEMLAARDDVEQHLLAIYDILDDSSATIFNRVTSSYGIRSNPDIRRRENEMYSRQLGNLVESYNQMRSSLNDEPFSLDPEISAFIANLDIRCMEVVDRIRRTQNTIRDNLFKVRELETRARKIRAVADHMRHNPGFEALRTQDALDKHPYFRTIDPMPVLATPNLEDVGVEEACTELVGRLSETLKYEPPKVTREDSTLRDKTQAEHVAEISPLDKMVKRMLSQCIEKNAPISALAFWNTQEREPEIADLDESEWLYAIALYMDGDPVLPSGQNTSNFVELYTHATAAHPLSGSCDLVDLYAYPVSFSIEEVKRLAVSAPEPEAIT